MLGTKLMKTQFNKEHDTMSERFERKQNLNYNLEFKAH